MTIGQQLTDIARTLHGYYDWQRVVIKRYPEGVTCETKSNFWYFLPKWLSGWTSKTYQAENRQTLNYFYSVFGRRRINAIAKRYDLHLEGRALAKRDIRQLFVGLGEVYVDDVHDLFLKLKGTREAEGELDHAAMRSLRLSSEMRFESLNRAELNELYSRLVPFETVRSIFLNEIPNFGFSSNFDSVEDMRCKRVYLTEKLRRGGTDFEMNKFRAWVAKSMLKASEQPVGVLIPGPRGFYQVYGRLQWGGASLVLLKSMQEGVPSIVKFQGTRTNLSSKDAVLSVLDDFSDAIGEKGFEAIEEALLYLLGRRRAAPEGFEKMWRGLDPARFRREDRRAEKFDFSAFSLGCAQTQHFIAAHPDTAETAFLMCAPGISKQKCHAYAVTPRGPELIYSIEWDDRVNRAGECKLGFWEKRGAVKLLVFSAEPKTRAELQQLLSDPPSLPESLFWLTIDFFKAFLFAHGRHTSVDDDGTTKLEEYQEFDMDHGPRDALVVQKVLSNDDLEGMRLLVRTFYRRMRDRKRAIDACLHSLFHW